VVGPLVVADACHSHYLPSGLLGQRRESFLETLIAKSGKEEALWNSLHYRSPGLLEVEIHPTLGKKIHAENGLQ
jgi:hypothetical protein